VINRSNIRLIIGLMVLALTGLIGIQIYWIDNAVTLERQRFESTVNSAMSNVVEHIEKQEVAENVRKRFDASRQGKTFFMGIDSLIRQNINRKDTTTSGLVFWNEVSPGELQAEFRQLNADGTVEVIEENFSDSASGKQFRKVRRSKQTDGGKFFSDVAGSVNSFNKTGDQRFERLMKKSGLVTDVFKELFDLNMRTGVEDRVNPKTIDSLLRTEFALAGINTPFEFGLYDFTNNKVFVDHPTDYTQELMKTRFRMRLFPHDIFYHPDYLMLYFPEQSRYVFSNLRLMFATSGFFILIIIGTFYYTIATIIRQKRLSDIKNDFINNMTHELKTPISTISLACEALNDADMAKTPRLVENYSRMIAEENKRLAQLVENVLQSALLEKSDFKLQITSVDVHQVIERVLKSMRMHIEKRKVKIDLQLKAKRFEIEADTVHLTNVVFNLVDNALKYTPESPEIKIETREQNGQFVLAVSDNGIGISRDQQKKIFEKLYRVPTGNIHNVKGFGLGLSYVKVIVGMHHGQIKLESEPDVGSTFSVYLPYNQPAAQ
jgi:two-component system phosphate regulon sensor histidine kinase PhoR